MVLTLNFQDHGATAKAMPELSKTKFTTYSSVSDGQFLLKINLKTLHTDFWLWVTCLSSAVVPS